MQEPANLQELELLKHHCTRGEREIEIILTLESVLEAIQEESND